MTLKVAYFGAYHYTPSRGRGRETGVSPAGQLISETPSQKQKQKLSDVTAWIDSVIVLKVHLSVWLIDQPSRTAAHAANFVLRLIRAIGRGNSTLVPSDHALDVTFGFDD